MPTMTQAGYTPPQKSAPTRANPPGKPKKPKKNRKQKKGIGAAGIVSLVIFLIAVLIGSCALFLYAQTAPYSDIVFAGNDGFRLCAWRVDGAGGGGSAGDADRRRG